LSCSKEKEDINSKPKVDFNISDDIDHFSLYSNSKDIDGDILTYEWTSLCDTIKIINPHSSYAHINLPKLIDSAQLKIKLVVSDGHLSDSTFKCVILPRYTLERIYGLGKKFHKGHSNNVTYNWYYDQMNTGAYASVNCGPTSVTMAIKWANENSNKVPSDARNTYRQSGGWWYTSDIINYLNQNSINNYTIKIDQIDSIQSQINLGNIVILNLDMYYIRREEISNWHIDKFYGTGYTYGWGHFIVIKGYKIVDDKIYYEVYDPYSFGLKYNNDTLKGENRYYRSDDLNRAVINWWNYAIIVSKSKLKGSNYAVDVSKILHKPGL
jgi:hypothetical protein